MECQSLDGKDDLNVIHKIDDLGDRSEVNNEDEKSKKKAENDLTSASKLGKSTIADSLKTQPRLEKPKRYKFIHSSQRLHAQRKPKKPLTAPVVAKSVNNWISSLPYNTTVRMVNQEKQNQMKTSIVQDTIDLE